MKHSHFACITVYAQNTSKNEFNKYPSDSGTVNHFYMVVVCHFAFFKQKAQEKWNLIDFQ